MFTSWPGLLPWAGWPGSGSDVTQTARMTPTTASARGSLCRWQTSLSPRDTTTPATGQKLVIIMSDAQASSHLNCYDICKGD